jgi:hypothetical protein
VGAIIPTSIRIDNLRQSGEDRSLARPEYGHTAQIPRRGSVQVQIHGIRICLRGEQEQREFPVCEPLSFQAPQPGAGRRGVVPRKAEQAGPPGATPEEAIWSSGLRGLELVPGFQAQDAFLSCAFAQDGLALFSLDADFQLLSRCGGGDTQYPDPQKP